MTEPKRLGERFKEVIPRGMSYQALADLLNREGVTTPKGGEITKSRIAQYASNQRYVPNWFVDALTVILELPEGWQNGNNAERPMRRADLPPGTAKVHLFPPLSEASPTSAMKDTERTGRTVVVPDFMAHCIAVPVPDDEFAPIFEAGDVLLLNMSAAFPLAGKAYSVMTLDGKSSIAKVIRENGSTRFKTTGGVLLKPSDVTVEGRIDGVLAQYDPNHRRFDIDDQGKDFPNW